MKRFLLLALLPLSANAITLVTDPVDPKATHCGVYQEATRLASSPVLPTAAGNICSYKVTSELSSFGKHTFRVTAQILNADGSVKIESAKSNAVVVHVTLDAPTNLTAQ
jgi:CO dehydrogenase/acetyl-CoA synthase gamma subunit (corrinoid Fe-S protein)